MSTPIPLRIYLIRHGETKWSLSGRHTGSTDIPLTKNGERESQQLGHRIQTIKFSRIICSPLQRALRTCELSLPDSTIETEPDLKEWHYGDYEGMHTYEILKARCPPRSVSERGR